MQVQTLLYNMSGKLSFTGDKVKTVSYNLLETNKRISTIAIYTNKFTGRIYFEGSLKDNPSEDSDWFIIPLDNDKNYLEFDNIHTAFNIKENLFINIYGSFPWIRARMDRSYLNIPIQKKKPYEYTSSTYIIDANTDMNQGFSHSLYTRSTLNPQYDPAYTNDSEINYDKNNILRHYGNIEKIDIIY